MSKASYLWDYNKEKLKKTESGRLKILERMINYGVDRGEKIKISEVKANWNNLKGKLDPKKKRLFEHLIWKK